MILLALIFLVGVALGVLAWEFFSEWHDRYLEVRRRRQAGL